MSTLTIANDGRKIIKSYHGMASVPEGQHYQMEIKTRKATKTVLSESKSILSEIEKLKQKDPPVPAGGGGIGSR